MQMDKMWWNEIANKQFNTITIIHNDRSGDCQKKKNIAKKLLEATEFIHHERQVQNVSCYSDLCNCKPITAVISREKSDCFVWLTYVWVWAITSAWQTLPSRADVKQVDQP